MEDIFCCYRKKSYFCRQIELKKEMLRQEEISKVIDAQWSEFSTDDTGFEREILPQIPVVMSFATIITGIRRCGKSTLLRQLLRQRFLAYVLSFLPLATRDRGA